MPVAAPLGGAAGAVALDEEQLAGVLVVGGAVHQLAGQAAAGEHPLAVADQLAGLPRRLARLGRQLRLGDHLLGRGRVLLEELGELVVDDLGDDPLDLAVAQLRLGLALELRVGHADADDRRQALLEVLAGDRQVFVLGRRGRLRVVVQGPRQRGPEPGQVGAPLDRVDVVAVRDDHLADRFVVLQRDLDFNGALLVFAREHHRRVDRRLRPVQVRDELAQPAGREELLVADLVAALVGQADRDPPVQVGQLAEPLLQHVVVEVDDREDLGVGQERDLGAGLLRRPGRADRPLGDAPGW